MARYLCWESSAASIASQAADYAGAAGASGALTLSAAADKFGQDFGGGAYTVHQTFVEFDLSGIDDGETIRFARFLPPTIHAHATAGFDVQVRLHDWGGEIAAGDFVPSADLASAGTLVASGSCEYWGNPWSEANHAALNSTDAQADALRAAASAAQAGDGILRVVVYSRHQADLVAPTGADYVEGHVGGTGWGLQVLTDFWYGPVGYGGWGSSNLSSYAVLACPGARQGDVLAAFVSVSHSGAMEIAPPAGWTEIAKQTCAEGTGAVFAKVATAADIAGEHVFGFSPSTGYLMIASAAFYGIDTEGDPFGVASAVADADGTKAFATLTQTTAANLLIALVLYPGAAVSSGGCSSPSVANDNPATWYANFIRNWSLYGSNYLSYARRDALGATGAGQATGSSDDSVDVLWLLPGLEYAPHWPTITINNNAATTDDNDVVLTMSATPEPAEMAFSEDGLTWSDWEPWATSRAFKLSPQTAYPTQTKSVYLAVRG